jgi:hypothetical protein
MASFGVASDLERTKLPILAVRSESSEQCASSPLPAGGEATKMGAEMLGSFSSRSRGSDCEAAFVDEGGHHDARQRLWRGEEGEEDVACVRAPTQPVGRVGDPSDFSSVAASVLAWAATHPDSPAVRTPGGQYSYADLAGDAWALAGEQIACMCACTHTRSLRISSPLSPSCKWTWTSIPAHRRADVPRGDA